MLLVPMDITKEIQKRRTFAIISHPDAGKTTLTEKLLLYGGAVHLAGSVTARKNQRATTSDWMELEKKRGIDQLNGAAIRLRWLSSQPARYARPQRFFRRHLPRAHRCGFGRHGD